MKEIDARGLDCPKPVILTKKAIEQLNDGEGICTVVDNEVAKENLKKLFKSMNIEVEIREENGDYKICSKTKIDKLKIKDSKQEKINKNIGENTVIFFDKNKMGHGNDELGDVLINGYIYTLTELATLPSVLIFVNGGVKLTTKGSKAIEDIKKLEDRGVKILSCGTCLDYYNLVDSLEVGIVTNMYEIVEELMGATNTISI